jgi:hypothetical protein
MSIWNKVLIGFILVASLVFFYMALRTLKTHQHWQELAERHDNKIKEIQQDNRQLIEGTGQGKGYQPGIEALKLQLRKELAGQGRVWTACKPLPSPQTAQTGEVAVACDVHGIGQRTPLYVFDDTDFRKGGRYLGQFKVVKVDEAGKRVDLAPSMKMTPGELQRLAASAAGSPAWTMYEVMPADSHEAFAHVPEEELEGELKSLFPAENVEEYRQDGKLLTTEEVEKLGLRGKLVAVDANGRVMYVDQNKRTLYASAVDEKGRLVYVDEKGNFACAAAVQKKVDANGQVIYDVQYFDENGQVLPGTRVVQKEVEKGKGKYLRELCDYAVLLTGGCLRRAELAGRIANAAGDLAYVKTALADAQKEQKSWEREKTQLIADKQRCEYARAAAEKLLKDLTREVQADHEAAVRLIAQNMKLAADLDQMQQEAKRRIDARTGRVAQSGAGAQ